MTHVKIASKLQRDHDLDSTNDKTLSKNVTTHNYSDQEKYSNQKNEKHSTRPESARYSRPKDHKQNRKMKRSDRLKQRALAKKRANLLAIGMKMAILSGSLFFSISFISIVHVFAGLLKIDILPIEMVFN